MKAHHSRRCGQSIVEYVVLLALIAIIVTTIVSGIGQSSRSRLAQANEAIDEATVASHTQPAGQPAAGGVSGHPPKF
jgi:Flp pilus assembly pilin Flp